MSKPSIMRIKLTLALVSVTLLANAQINNGGFEDLNSTFLPQYWTGDLHILAVTFDSMGVAHVDSVVYDGGNDYALSTDAHSGQYAMELRNGYNFTTNSPLIGRIHASTDTNAYQSFPLASIPIMQHPLSIGFWAKYAPFADDSAEVTVTVLDAAENPIGSGHLAIGGGVPLYTLFEVPIAYTTTDVAAFMQLTFANATYAGTATFGTRLLIDDVSVTFAPDAVGEMGSSDPLIELFPVPANDHCTVRSAAGTPVLAVNVLGMDGRTCAMPALETGGFDTTGLPSGSYVLAVRAGEATAFTRLLVVH